MWLKVVFNPSSRARSRKASRGVLALLLAELRQGEALVGAVPLLNHLHHDHGVPVGAGVGELLDILLHGLTGRRVAELGRALFGTPDQWLNPVGHVVEHVVFGQSELRHRVHGVLLNDHGQPGFTGLLGPGKALLVVPHGDVQGPATAPHHFREEGLLLEGRGGDPDGPAEMTHAELREHVREGQELVR